jgi:UDP-N-acetylglucosamine enolpyruvyl transferase
LKEDFFDIISRIDKLLRLHHVSYQGISDIMALIYPQGRDTIFNAFADSVEKTVIPPIEDFQIVLYFVKGAPATNNGVENYYSTSLKTHRKKQLRTDKGIENQMKLSAMKRAGLLGRCKKTRLEAFLMFWYSLG